MPSSRRSRGTRTSGDPFDPYLANRVGCPSSAPRRDVTERGFKRRSLFPVFPLEIKESDKGVAAAVCPVGVTTPIPGPET